MSDIVDQATRSRMMSGIRGKDTRPEKVFRHALFAKGFRYRLNVAGLPGKPDIVFPKYRAVVFVHGCFWHGHKDCRFFRVPATNTAFWTTKISGNINRDAQKREQLKGGWRVATVWECALQGRDVETVAERVAGWLKGTVEETEIRG